MNGHPYHCSSLAFPNTYTGKFKVVFDIPGRFWRPGSRNFSMNTLYTIDKMAS